MCGRELSDNDIAFMRAVEDFCKGSQIVTE